MAKDKKDRYKSVSEFLEDLRNYEFLDTKEADLMRTRGATRAMSTVKPAASSRFRLAIPALIIVGAGCLAVAAMLFLRQPDQAAPPALPAAEHAH